MCLNRICLSFLCVLENSDFEKATTCQKSRKTTTFPDDASPVAVWVRSSGEFPEKTRILQNSGQKLDFNELLW